MHFVLVGDLPAQCLAGADLRGAKPCRKSGASEAIQEAMAAMPDGMRWVTQLRKWQLRFP